jgi:uncharacterized protein YwqG
MTLELPAALEPFREKILLTKQAFVQIKPVKARDCTVWESKVGGLPYLPLGIPFPTAPDGNPLSFLAQINFAEMPALDPFPQKGILQFYIHDDDLYGMDFDDGENPDTFRVLYFPEITTSTAALQTSIPTTPYELLPHHPEMSFPLTFALKEAILPATDYQFATQFGAGFFEQFGAQEWDVLDEFSKKNNAQGHKIGGYAYFTQDDPRRPEDPMLLLLQLDSDELMDLMWGDMGVGHFFIREKDLRAGDFSKVLYDWDCL